MSRSGYIDGDGCDEFDALRSYGWRANVNRCINGRRGQAFMWELYLALEALPKRELITGALVSDESGSVCALGAVAVRRGMEIPDKFKLTDDEFRFETDMEFAEAMGPLFGLKDMLAREVMYVNDEEQEDHFVDDGTSTIGQWYQPGRKTRHENSAERFQRVRAWVVSELRDIP